jgi:ribonuclease HI
MAVKIYTDGACEPNPGYGGWGVVIIYPNGSKKELFGNRSHTTNNRMELLAVIKGLQYVEKEDKIIIYSDSQYIVNGINSWLDTWKRKGKRMKNMDLWDELYELKKKFKYIEAKWVRGHTGDCYNERADQLSYANIPSGGRYQNVSKDKVDEYLDKKMLKYFGY